MFIKAINEEDVKNEAYVTRVITENFSKLIHDEILPDKENESSNIIMAIALNRILVDLYPKFAFKNNQSEINKYFEKGLLYEITLGKKEVYDEEDLDLPYLKRHKLTLTRVLKKDEEDILLEDNPSYTRFNYFTNLLNGCLLDEAGRNKYDYYKSQYLYMAILWMSKHNLDLDSSMIKPMDNYLDSMRTGLDSKRCEVFLLNARNSYYNLNPYGELRPMDEVLKLGNLIDELNTHEFDDDMEREAQDLIRSIRRFMETISQKDIPSMKRREILEDSDFLNAMEFYRDLSEDRIDNFQMEKMKKLPNLSHDFERLNREALESRDK